MLLFRYFSKGLHVLQTIRELQLKLSKISEFNDPFECMYSLADEPTYEEALASLTYRVTAGLTLEMARPHFPGLEDAQIQERLLSTLPDAAKNFISNFSAIQAEHMRRREESYDKFMRVCCFSDSSAEMQSELLMWAHYADKHTGLRLGFGFPAGGLYPFKMVEIEYKDARLQLDLMHLQRNPEQFQAGLEKAQKRKNPAWKYEKEHRLIASTRAASLIWKDQMTFVAINPLWLRRLDFGAKFPPAERDSITELIKKRHPHIECFQATYHSKDFALRYIKLEL